jgi:hypothetical protein
MKRNLMVGRWYDLNGKPMRVLEVEGALVRVVAASGAERLLPGGDLGDRVEDAAPGVTERCLVCNGREIVPDIKSNGASKPCPNCRGLD